ncbi:MAG: aldo/keto reductase, partial [Clostridiales bacterium]|nr:aldo/keto reductase [Clostridiales bacterium]
IQYNYLDENNQAGKSGLEYAAGRGLPVMIMEPLRGGTLATGLPRDVLDVFDGLGKSRSPAEWGLRWVWNHPEVTLLLSGMNTMPVLEENIAAASSALPGALTPAELEVIEKAREILSRRLKVPCTGCNYCMPCPYGVDIPTCFACYNNIGISGFLSAIKSYFQTTIFQKNPSNASRCVKCGKCESHCPQSIEIRRELDNVKKKLEPFYFKPASWVARKVMRI